MSWRAKAASARTCKIAHGKATGLIQFMPNTLVGLGWTQGPDAFKTLTAEQQLPFVEKFFSRPCDAGTDLRGTALPSDFPARDTARIDKSTIIAGPHGPNADAYVANKLLDTNQDGVITVSDLTNRINNVRQGPRWDALMQRLTAAQ